LELTGRFDRCVGERSGRFERGERDCHGTSEGENDLVIKKE